MLLKSNLIVVFILYALTWLLGKIRCTVAAIPMFHLFIHEELSLYNHEGHSH